MDTIHRSTYVNRQNDLRCFDCYTDGFGCFRLFEHSPLWRMTDKTLGKVSILLHPFAVFGVLIVLSSLVSFIFGLSIIESIAVGLSGLLGCIFVNAHVDYVAVSTFEKHCINCPNATDCQTFQELTVLSRFFLNRAFSIPLVGSSSLFDSVLSSRSSRR